MRGNLSAMDHLRLHVAWAGSADRDLEQASLGNEVERARRISFGIEKATRIMESWVLRSQGSMVATDGVEGQCIVPAEHLQDLPDMLRQYASASGADVAAGVGQEPQEALTALVVAQKRGGDQSIVLYTPDIAQEADDDGDGELDPLLPEEQDALEGREMPIAKAAFGNEPSAGEATKIQQGALSPSAAAPSAPPSPSASALPMNQQQSASESSEGSAPGGQPAPEGGPEQLKQAIGAALMDVKKQIPVFEKMKESSPAAYDAVMGMVQALIMLAQQVVGGEQPQAGQPVQKSLDGKMAKALMSEERLREYGQKYREEMTDQEMREHPHLSREDARKLVDDHLEEDPGYYTREKKPEGDVPPCEECGGASVVKCFGPGDDRPECTKCGWVGLEKGALQVTSTGRHHLHLPPGTAKDGRVKVVHADGSSSWVSVRAGQIASEDGHAISSRNPGGR